MKKILYDLIVTQPSRVSKFHGAGFYGEVIFLALLEYTDSIEIHCVYDSRRYLNPLIEKAISGKKIRLHDIRGNSLQHIIDQEHIDIFYTPLYHRAALGLQLPRNILTIHGLRELELQRSQEMLRYHDGIANLIRQCYQYWHFPKMQKDRYIYFKEMVDQQAELITVSEHSRASLVYFFPELRNREIHVFYSPLLKGKENLLLEGNPFKSEISPRKYFLMVSGERWSKNNLSAVRALDAIFDRNPGLDIKGVVTGCIRRRIYEKSVRHPEKFVFLDFVEREQLCWLHQNARAFLYPSFNEGFGYPPMESMRWGVPVAAAGVSAIPEICGDAALYFDPYNPAEISNRILQLLNPIMHQRLSALSLERYSFVSERQNADLSHLIDFLIQGA